jgi:hypothetical protein
LVAVKPKQKRSIPAVAIVAIVAAAIGAAGFWYLERDAPPPQGPSLTPEAKGYVRNLRLSDVEMKAHESYLRQAVIEINGRIGNNGERVLKLVQINCVFRDPYGQVVLRERVTIAGAKAGDLNPGEVKPFRLAFDNVPESWNQALPDLVIAHIQFGS